MNTFVICNNKEEVQSHVSCWGNATFELSIKDISALLQGKTLAGDYGGEYSIFITMESKE
jgi:hypothetical protein